MDTLQLNENVQMPVLGFGTATLDNPQGQNAIEAALDVGYRHIDTADWYDSHPQVGAAVNASDVPRSEIHITSKVWPTEARADDVKRVVDDALNDLDTDYIDLFLIHWPRSEIPFSETLGAMNTLKDQGVLKALGVSNFMQDELDQALATGFEVANNQCEFHPSLFQKCLIEYCKNRGVTFTAYSPLAQSQDLNLELIQEIAQRYERTPAQVILNWILSKGVATIPRSSDPSHVRENLGALGWSLVKEDIERIDGIDTWNRVIDPDFIDFGDTE